MILVIWIIDVFDVRIVLVGVVFLMFVKIFCFSFSFFGVVLNIILVFLIVLGSFV